MVWRVHWRRSNCLLGTLIAYFLRFLFSRIKTANFFHRFFQFFFCVCFFLSIFSTDVCGLINSSFSFVKWRFIELNADSSEHETSEPDDDPCRFFPKLRHTVQIRSAFFAVDFAFHALARIPPPPLQSYTCYISRSLHISR